MRRANVKERTALQRERPRCPATEAQKNEVKCISDQCLFANTLFRFRPEFARSKLALTAKWRDARACAWLYRGGDVRNLETTKRSFASGLRPGKRRKAIYLHAIFLVNSPHERISRSAFAWQLAGHGIIRAVRRRLSPQGAAPRVGRARHESLPLQYAGRACALTAHYGRENWRPPR